MTPDQPPSGSLRCAHFPTCGGCTALNLPYREQLRIKHRKLVDLFGNVTDSISPFAANPQPYYYRHKVQLPFGYEGRSGGLTLGCYAVDSHKVVNQLTCLIQDRDCSTVAWTVRKWARRTGMTVFNERSAKGFLRHVLLRKAAATGEILVGLVTNGARIEGSRQLARLLLSMIEEESLSCGRVVGIVQNVNTRDTNVVLGNEEYVWWGRPFVKERLGEWNFKVGLSTFFQINPFQTPILYNEVLRHIPARARVLDCYCGVGSISLWISRMAELVTGIEENHSSVRAARAAASINKVNNVSFYVGDVSAELPRLSRQGYTCAVFDPPRKGLSPELPSIIASSSLERIVYVSCNPQTLRRDTELLAPSFRLVSIQGVDMFAHTDHIECVALFDRVIR